MEWYYYLTYFSLAVCILSCFWHLSKLLVLGAPEDYSTPIGNTVNGIKYSFTGAMSPKKKESAYLHLPTYTAGLIYHAGTFLSIFLFFLILFGVIPAGIAANILAIVLSVSAICGLLILMKRIVKKSLRSLSQPDDYFSNGLVTLFQFLTAYSLFTGQATVYFFLGISALLLYLPLGKLKHTIYFFAARYHLGYFYGRRGVWPPEKI